MSSAPEQLADGLWRWTARHPEWHPGQFGAEVASFAASAGDGTLLLIDPLLPPDPAPVLAVLDEHATGRVAILISIPYHVRSSEELRGGVTPYAIGKPRRQETPLHIPSHDALVFGDAVVEHEGALKVWAHDKV